MKKSIYFIKIKRTNDDTWLNSSYKDKIVPVTIDHSFIRAYPDYNELIFIPYRKDSIMAPFFIPFNAVIVSTNAVPSTQEEAQMAIKTALNVDMPPYEDYDSTPLTELYPNMIWYKEV